MKITFLGTSSFPTKDRNSQSTLIEFGTATAIIVDCGEGTQRQLMHLGDAARKINAIYLTHHHIDHVAGLPGLVMYLYKIRKEKIRIIAPRKTLDVSKLLISTLVEECIDVPVEYIEVNESYSGLMGTVKVSCFRTYHTSESVGYSFCDKDLKVTVCGDLEIHNREQRNKIQKSIYGSDKVIIDIVHMPYEEALELLEYFKDIEKVLLPVPYGRNNLLEESLKINGTQILNDYDFIE